MNRLKLAAGFAAVALLATPAAASAHAKPSTQSVRAHVRSADQALTKVAALIDSDKDAAAAIQMVRNRRQIQAATREAACIRSVSGRATALRLVAKQRNVNAESYAALVDEAAGALQADIARAISANVNGREIALGTLTNLLPSLPAAARAAVAAAIAALSSDGGDEVTSIVNALQSGDITSIAQPYVDAALAVATSAIGMGLERLQGIVAELPAEAQEPVQGAIAQVTAILQAILGGGSQAILGGGASPLGGILSALPIGSGMSILGALPFVGGGR